MLNADTSLFQGDDGQEHHLQSGPTRLLLSGRGKRSHWSLDEAVFRWRLVMLYTRAILEAVCAYTWDPDGPILTTQPRDCDVAIRTDRTS